MSNLRNKSFKMNIGIGTLEIFQSAKKFNNLKMNYKSFKEEKYSYTPWILCDEVFISRNSSVISNNLTKYEYINSFTKFKDNVPIDIVNQYNVYKREMIKIIDYKGKIMKKVA